jgi:hypothetical protein
MDCKWSRNSFPLFSSSPANKGGFEFSTIISRDFSMITITCHVVSGLTSMRTTLKEETLLYKASSRMVNCSSYCQTRVVLIYYEGKRLTCQLHSYQSRYLSVLFTNLQISIPVCHQSLVTSHHGSIRRSPVVTVLSKDFE